MGVDRTDYIVYGWKLPFKIENSKGPIDIWDEKFLPYIEGHPGVEYTIVYDGMSGEYTVFGKLLAQASDDGDGWGFKELSTSSIDPIPVNDKFIELFEMEPPAAPSLFIFSHYS